MIGACSVLRRKPEDSVAKFKKHWLAVHGPLAAELHGVRRYLQSHFANDSPETNDLARSLGVNGLAEMWFDTEEDRQICYDSEQEKVCDVDSLLFIGATARVVSDVIPHVQLSGVPAPYKQVFLFLDNGGSSRQVDFKRIATLADICGLTEHKVNKPGAQPTQDRDSVEADIRAIVTLASLGMDDMKAARSIVTDDEGDRSVAAFACIEYYIV